MDINLTELIEHPKYVLKFIEQADPDNADTNVKVIKELLKRDPNQICTHIQSYLMVDSMCKTI